MKDKIFTELLEYETLLLKSLEEADDPDYTDEECFFLLDESERLELQEELGYTEEEMETLSTQLYENIVRRVNSSGKVSKVLNRSVRSRRATLTTGMSKTQLKRRARKAALTKKRNPTIVRKALRKRKRALRKRKSMGIR